MSKRKPPPSKHARGSKTATKVQSAASAVERAKDSRPQAANPTEPPLKGHETEQESRVENLAAAVQSNEREQEPRLVENYEAALQPTETKKEPCLAENSATALQLNNTSQEALCVQNPALAVEDGEQMTINKDSKRGLDFPSAAANAHVYQAKLLGVAQANLQFAFEFAERLAAIRSPFEFLGVTAEFTSKRIAMFQKHSKEIAELSN